MKFTLVNVIKTSAASLLLAVFFMAGCGSEPGERQLREGKEALRDGEYVVAKTWFENTISGNTDSRVKLKAYNYLGVACWKLNELREALQAFESAREIDPEYMNAIYNLGLLKLETGDSERAAELIEEAAMLSPNDQRALEYLGAIYMRNRRWEDARRTYINATEIKPNSARILTAAGLAELNMQRFDEAERLWYKALEADPDFAPALYNLALLKIRITGEIEEGAIYADRFFTEETSGSRAQRLRDALQNPGELRAESEQDGKSEGQRDDLLEIARAARESDGPGMALNICLQEAISARRAGDTLRQLEALQTATIVCPELARSHYALGRFYLENDDIDRATRSIRQALAISPDSDRALVAFAECSIAGENYDAALISLRRALRVEDKNANALWLLAELYDQHMEDAEAAIDAYEDFAGKHPGDPRVLTANERIEILRPEVMRKQLESTPLYDEPAPERERDPEAALREFSRGARAQSEENWERAIEHYRQAVTLDPELTRAHFNLGVTYGAAGRDEDAARAYSQAIELEPNHLSARFNLALIHYNQGRYRECVRELEGLLAIDSDHARGHFLLGLTYAENMGDIRRAKRHYGRFLEIEPEDPSAPAVRAWLERN